MQQAQREQRRRGEFKCAPSAVACSGGGAGVAGAAGSAGSPGAPPPSPLASPLPLPSSPTTLPMLSTSYALVTAAACPLQPAAAAAASSIQEPTRMYHCARDACSE